MNSTVTRRAALIGALTSSATLAVPVIAAVAPKPEHPNQMVRRLGREIKDALNDPRFVGFQRVVITPNYVGMSDNDPDTRVAYAIEDIKIAIAEQHPNWKFQVEDRAIGNIEKGVLTPPRRRGILIYGSNLQFGRERAAWFVDYTS